MSRDFDAFIVEGLMVREPVYLYRWEILTYQCLEVPEGKWEDEYRSL